MHLSRYNIIVGPLAKAIKALESTHTTPADVFMFWVAICAFLKELFERPPKSTGIPQEMANHVVNIVNKRFNSFINQYPSDLHFAAFFLDPCKYWIVLSFE